MTKEEKKARSRAAWRAWYQRNKEEVKKYYKERYAQRVKDESKKEREARLARGRKNQKKYASRRGKLKE